MKICEYVNNLLSLNTLDNLVKTERGIYHVKFYNDQVHSTSQVVFYNNLDRSYFKLKVEKLLFVPLNKIIKFDLGKEYDIIEEYRIKNGGIIPLELIIDTRYDIKRSGIELREAIVVGNPTKLYLMFG